jgi:hypothetical protein
MIGVSSIVGYEAWQTDGLAKIPWYVGVVAGQNILVFPASSNSYHLRHLVHLKDGLLDLPARNILAAYLDHAPLAVEDDQ